MVFRQGYLLMLSRQVWAGLWFSSASAVCWVTDPEFFIYECEPELPHSPECSGRLRKYQIFDFFGERHLNTKQEYNHIPDALKIFNLFQRVSFVVVPHLNKITGLLRTMREMFKQFMVVLSF